MNRTFPRRPDEGVATATRPGRILRFAALGALALVATACRHPSPALTGLSEGREIAVAAKLPGRLVAVRADEGDTVRAGDTVAVLGSPETTAKVLAAEGAVRSAEARLAMARHGARPEEIRMAASALEQASQGRMLAETTWKRIQSLLADSAVPPQQADEVRLKWRLAVETEDAARARLEMVRKGARPEEIEAAEGLVQSARNQLAEARSWEREAAVLAPVDGVVQKRYLAAGEVAGAGAPILVLIQPAETWVVLALREDQLRDFPIGTLVEADIPALGAMRVPLRTTWHASMGDFATWRSTSRKGDADLRSFEVRLEPVHPLSGFLPGMTVRVHVPGGA